MKSWRKWESTEMGKFSVLGWYLLRKRKSRVEKSSVGLEF